MLERLTIRDLAVVERVEIPFGAGLVCVTGETGAGKSLVVQAIGLLVGGRSDADAVREGAGAAIVEGEFHVAGEVRRRVDALLEEWGLDAPEDGALIVRREVQASGRGRATVNQSPVTLAALKRLGETLADLHGQHDHQSLLRADAGVALLDGLGGNGEEKLEYVGAVAAWRAATAERERVEAALAGFEERGDWLREAARELDEAKLLDGEAESLAIDAARLAHTDKLRALASTALDSLSEGEQNAAATLAAAVHDLEQAARLDPSLEESLPALRESLALVQDWARGLAGYLDHLEADPQALEAVEARRDLLARLERKYRRPVGELIAWRAEIAGELDLGDNRAETLARCRAAVADAARECRRRGEALTRRRAAAAKVWGPKLTKALRPLGLPHATLAFALAPREEEGSFAANGLDQVRIDFTPNPGEPARPLHQIASGGELSRVMLALKSALESRDSVDLLLFDEVDSGIGGAVGQAVGERLLALSRHRQVVCVTHLPMIAALAAHHLVVRKSVASGRTRARIEPVQGADRIEEIARMLAGERVTDTTRRQARELIAGGPAAGAGELEAAR